MIACELGLNESDTQYMADELHSGVVKRRPKVLFVNPPGHSTRCRKMERLKGIGMIENKVLINGELSVERRHYICTLTDLSHSLTLFGRTGVLKTPCIGCLT